MKNLNKVNQNLAPSAMQIGLSLILSVILLSVTSCVSYTKGSFCNIYEEIYISDNDSLTAQTYMQIDENNIAYYCGCVNPKDEICKDDILKIK